MADATFQFTQLATSAVLWNRYPFLDTIGALERWEDDNYRPHAIRVEVRDAEDQFQVTAELPGLKPEQVRVGLSRRTLFILVSPAAENGAGDEQYAEIPIPPRFRTDKAQVSYLNDVLSISVAPRRLQILKQPLATLNALLNQPRSRHTRAEGIATGD